MALQIWLPLNGNYNNYGLSGNDAISVGNALSFSTKGKIGQYYCSGGSLNSNKSYMKLEGTVCAWVKVDSSANKSAQFYGNAGTEASPNNRKFSIFFYPNSVDLHSWGLQYDSSSSNNGVFTVSNVLSDGWNHIAVSHDYKKQYIYVNGELKGTYYYNSNGDVSFNALTRLFVANQSHGFCDYRVYDNCLSSYQIKEISKGLMCHYKLNNNGYGLSNILPNTDNYSSWGVDSGWTKSYDENGDIIWSYSRTGATSNIWYRLVSEYLDINLIKENGLLVTYDLKVEDLSVFNQKCVCSINVHDANKSRTNWYEPQISTSGMESNKWYRCFTYFNVIPNQTFFDVSFQLVQNGAISIKNIKGVSTKAYTTVYGGGIYKGLDVWCSHQNDIFYRDSDLNLEPDCSGFDNAGIKANLNYDLDTPLYNVSSLFNGTSSYVKLPKICEPEIFTACIWAYSDNYGEITTNDTRIISCTEGGGWNIEPNNGYIQFPVFVNGAYRLTTSSITFSSLSSGWHHFAIVYNGYKSSIYIDGEEVSYSAQYISTTYYPITYSSNNNATIYLGAESTSSVLPSNFFKGKLSDFRLYATALSQSDIKKIYNMRLEVSPKGEFHIYELQEDFEKIKLDKKGIVCANELIETYSICDYYDTVFKYTPEANITNSCMIFGSIDYSGFATGTKFIQIFDVIWSGFTEAAAANSSFNIHWQGNKTPASSWTDSDMFAYATTYYFDTGQPIALLTLVTSAKSGRVKLYRIQSLPETFPNTYTKERCQIRTNYSDGKAWISIENVLVIPYIYYTYEKQMKMEKNENIITTQIIEK